MKTFYYQKPSYVFGIDIIAVLGIAMWIFLIPVAYDSVFYTIFLIVMIIIGFFVIADMSCRKIKIDKKGVQYLYLYKRYLIQWEEIESIDIRGVVFRTRVNAICFFTKNADYIHIEPKNIGPNFIMMLNVEHKVIEEIHKYWSAKIGGMEYFNN